MNSEMGFLCEARASDSACLRMIRGELAIEAYFHAANLYSVGGLGPDHDAVMRIGGEAPGGGAILPVGFRASSNRGFPPPRIVNSAVRRASASAE